MGIKKHIPNFITSMNLLCGVIGVVFAFKTRLDVAFCLMLAAAVFDFLDGFAARLLGAYSDMGKELDSLADLVSFGVLPSLMLYSLMQTNMYSDLEFLCWVPLLIAVFSGLRLAKFNIDERQTNSFLGLPTPACALLCGSLCYFVCMEPASFLAAWACGPVFVPALSVILCALLVCELPMFSMKFSKDDSSSVKSKRLSFVIEVAIVLALTLIFGFHWSAVVLTTFVLYIVKNLFYALFRI